MSSAATCLRAAGHSNAKIKKVESRLSGAAFLILDF